VVLVERDTRESGTGIWKSAKDRNCLWARSTGWRGHEAAAALLFLERSTSRAWRTAKTDTGSCFLCTTGDKR
jgi:hypothetical protein